MGSKILPCPFCGSKARGPYDEAHNGRELDNFIVVCDNYLCSARIYNWGTREAVIKLWNKRLKMDAAIYGD